MTTEEKIAGTASAAPGAWAIRIKNALEAGQLPAYSDLEEGIEDLLQKNAALIQSNQMLMEFSKDAQEVISKMIVARHFNDTPKLLSILNDFMKAHVIVQDKTQAVH